VASWSAVSSDRRVWLRWTLAFTVGELVGFGLIPVTLGLSATALTDGMATGPRALLLYLVAIVGGLGEGAVLAWCQLGVLRRTALEVDGAAWIRHTALAASGAWALGMLAPTLDDLVGLSVPVGVGLTVITSVGILLSIGGVQARLLPVPRRWRWLVANVVGWLLGLPFTFVAPAILPDDAPLWAFGISFFVGGTLMGATAGGITGLALVHLVRDASGR